VPGYPHVLAELARVRQAAETLAAGPPDVEALLAELRQVNADLWAAEEEVRDAERRRDFGPGFVAAARAVYLRNDRRAVLKRRINELLGSPVLEVKSHVRYDVGTPRPHPLDPDPP
jgi:hypothetical protein